MNMPAISPKRAVIREDVCIGCAKCIQACPVDAILGAAKQMHTVIANECIGCELCVAPCPVDCIEMVPIPQPTAIEQQQKFELAKRRFEFRNQRLEQQRLEKQQKTQGLNYQQNKRLQRKVEIREIVKRVRLKKFNQI